jgi:hypothetical protein
LKESNADVYAIPGYHSEHLVRHNKSGGGVSLFVKDNLLHKRRHDLSVSDENIEILFIELSKQATGLQNDTLIGVVYRPPGTSIDSFNEILLQKLSRIKV